MITPNTLIVATRNKGKAAEFRALCQSVGYEVQTLLDIPELADVEETGTTFEENARLKAETIANQLNTYVIADDSGLVVDALGGMPGVYSARYAGDHKSDAANNAKLLAALSEVPRHHRTASFQCVIALAHPTKETRLFKGRIDGQIAEIPRGENGFGYDPLFYVPSKGKTMAELSEDEKNCVSHRAKAIKQLHLALDGYLN